MKYELLKEVWKLRCEKILKIEKESIDLYEKFLQQNAPLLKEVGADTVLEQIIGDEKKHAQLATELVNLANAIQVPEEATTEED